MNDTTTASERYQDALANLPESGGGGCHTAMLGVANLGVKAGLPDDVLFDDLRRSIHGSRPVPDKEIQDTIRKARSECNETRYIAPMPRQRTTKRTLEKILHEGRHGSEADIWEASPVRIDWPPEEDASRVLSFLYAPAEFLFCGIREEKAQPGEAIRPAGEWVEHFQAGNPIPPLVMPNPLTGEEALSKGGEPSYRSDSCVRSFRFALVEFDNLTRDEQIAFWTAIRLPVAALIDSGGKSIHGWIKVDCADVEAWEKDVERRLFMERLVPLGVDPACRNESRLSRLPGHHRSETGRWQRVLYLAPKGRPVNE
jgi:hypothetical protein